MEPTSDISVMNVVAGLTLIPVALASVVTMTVATLNLGFRIIDDTSSMYTAASKVKDYETRPWMRNKYNMKRTMDNLDDTDAIWPLSIWRRKLTDRMLSIEEQDNSTRAE